MEHTRKLLDLKGRHFGAAYITNESFCDSDYLQSAAGGLGVVADSFLYEFETNFERHKFTAIQILLGCSHGYQHQYVKHENGGFMGVTYKTEPPELVEDTGFRTTIILAGEPCVVGVQMPVEHRTHTAQLFLTTNLPENKLNHRMITHALYGEGHATSFFSEDGKPWSNIDWLRILQAAVLGLGSYHVIKELGITYDIFHLNESHGVFFLIHEFGLELKKGCNFGEALERVARKGRVTNHTVLDSGNKRYRTHEIGRILKNYAGFEEETLRKLGQKSDYTFSMTDAALFLVGPGHTNGVSVHHAEIANELWPGYNIIPITNGVSAKYQHPEFRNLTDPKDIPRLKAHFKELVYENLANRLREAGWDKAIQKPHNDAVLVTWARRCQDYKRAGLMWSSESKGLVEWLLTNNIMAIAWGGYVHPDDRAMMERWNEYWQKFRDLPNTMAIFNYRIDLMRPLLKAASQVWLNSPWLGFEACGTSFMSAMLNCALSVSILDGGAREAKHIIPFGSTERGQWHPQYEADARALWKTTLPYILKLHSNDPDLLAFLFDAKLEAEEKFSSTRMVHDYLTKLYKVR